VISVVIPMFNNRDVVGEQLDALAAQEYDGEWEVVIADNGSKDGSIEYARQWEDKLPSLTIVDASQVRRIVSYVRNVGCRAARGDYFLFTDADDVVWPGWLAAMAEASTRCHLLGGRLEDEKLNDSLVRAWRWAPPDGLPRTLNFLSYAKSNNCAASREAWEAVGGWGEEYIGGEDIDFFWRAQLAGYELCYVPDAIVSYRYREGLKPLAIQFYDYSLASPQLYRDFRDHGLRRKPLLRAAGTWAWLLVRVPLLLSERKRGTWIRNAAAAWGRIRGSWRFRVVYL
jgi:glycosyltransferase involved in cell wall biosynthesis